MKRTRTNGTIKANLDEATAKRLVTNLGIATEMLSRSKLARRMGYGYGDKRKLYEALGYPDETQLTFEYFFGLYDRNPFASAVVDRPCDATWKGGLAIVEDGQTVKDSPLNKAWKKLNKDFKLKARLSKADKLCEVGKYSIIVLGLNDVKKKEDFKNPVNGKRKLLYVKQVAESECTVHTWETNANSERYGLPLTYKLQAGKIQSTGLSSSALTEQADEIIVHHSRCVHLVSGNLTSEVFGVSKLKKIVNRLIDLDKLLGGDAEMFWRGARPGYAATAQEDYEMPAEAESDLMDQLDKYEHDLRRFLTLKGIDIHALEQQVEDPLNHIDAQLQAISAQTGIPKRILVGSERGELSSNQDADQWKDMIKARQQEHAEPCILRPFIDKLMEYSILPMVEEYNVMWHDVFAPSESEKVETGSKRATALKAYSDSPIASEVLTPKMFLKYCLGLDDDQIEEALAELEAQQAEENSLYDRVTETAETIAGKGAEEDEEEEDEEETEEEVETE